MNNIKAAMFDEQSLTTANLLPRGLLISFALRTGQGQRCTLALLWLTVVSIQLQTTLTDIVVYILKQEKSIQTSNKKHFMKNVKECRDVIVKKVLEQGWNTRTTHYTHVGPTGMTPYIVV